jgi:hypothetical protein
MDMQAFVQNLWLIPALPLLAAGKHALAPDRACCYTFAA